MGEQSQRDEMNAAIRAQRERQAVPRVISGEAPPPPSPAPAPPVAQPEPPPAPEAVPEPKKGLLRRLFGK
jgi:hypothetical protein